MRRTSFVRLTLAVFAITLWCGVFVTSAAAQSVTCTGNQSLADGSGDSCMSSATPGPQGRPGSASNVSVKRTTTTI
jgi:hypothetical protein